MRAWIAIVLLAGCLQAPEYGDDDLTPAEPAPADPPCPGHFHVTLLVADGDEVWPYFDEEDLDATDPPGIHMHGDDGIIHVHPPQEACFALGWTLFAVGVWAMERDGGAVQVGDEVRNGTVRFDIQRWGEDWATDIDAMQDPVPDGTRMLLMLDPPADVGALRAQVPEIPPNYRPS